MCQPALLPLPSGRWIVVRERLGDDRPGVESLRPTKEGGRGRGKREERGDERMTGSVD